LRGDRERFEDAGGVLALIGLGRPDQAGHFCRGRRVPFACLTSPDSSAHRAFGLRRGTLNQVAGPRVWLPWLRNAVTGNLQGRFGQGDAAQLPGTFVVDTAGVVRYAHRGRRSDDNPPNHEVLDVLTAIRGRLR
jgi:AhpC/TSA antioxidant enzyme